VAEALFDALEDPRAAVRWRAAEALHAIQPPAEVALPRLVSAMKSRDPYVRGFATRPGWLRSTSTASWKTS
jgi:HEAT repeat protein